MDQAIQRSQIPGNRQRRLAEMCRQKAAAFRKQSKRKLAANAENWAKDLEAQQAKHEATDRLIHLSGVPDGVCDRKDTKADERVTTYVPTRRRTIMFVERGTITDSGVASFLDNVDCLVCRRWARNRKVRP